MMLSLLSCVVEEVPAPRLEIYRDGQHAISTRIENDVSETICEESSIFSLGGLNRVFYVRGAEASSALQR